MSKLDELYFTLETNENSEQFLLLVCIVEKPSDFLQSISEKLNKCKGVGLPFIKDLFSGITREQLVNKFSYTLLIAVTSNDYPQLISSNSYLFDLRQTFDFVGN